jgi:hypothetical protein
VQSPRIEACCQSQIELGLACHQVPFFRAANHWLE